MTKLFRDLDYYIAEASNNTQRGFELDFADVIEVYDTNETTLVTEDGRTLGIIWNEVGLYRTYGLLFNEIENKEESTMLEQFDRVVGNYDKQIATLTEISELKDRLIEVYKDKLKHTEDMLESTNTLLGVYRKSNLKQ